jgi:hypothetical protein
MACQRISGCIQAHRERKYIINGMALNQALKMESFVLLPPKANAKPRIKTKH